MAQKTTIGVGLRVTGHSSQGGRKYMEDFFSVAYQQSATENDLEYAFFGIYDGHGGSEAAVFAKEHLMFEIVNQKLFWSDNDQDVRRAIREGYIATHYAMWRTQDKWPKTATGLPSTAGTTATVAFIRRGKIYVGHVGDSGVVLGYQEPGETFWRAKPLTQDHKPECLAEKTRIMNSGGKVITKSGVPRVVWNRPRIGHKGPVRRSTPIDEIPFLAVARSLGDLWSYNSANNEFVVSPDPDVTVIKIDQKTFRCLIFGTDGVWNVVGAKDAVDSIRDAEKINEHLIAVQGISSDWINPSKSLVDKALDTWSSKRMRADNTSVVTVMLDPPNMKKDTNGLDYHEIERYPQMAEHAYSHHQHHQDLYDDDDGMNRSHQRTSLAPPNSTYSNLISTDETSCDTSNYYFDNNTSSYMTTFAESYNSLLISSQMDQESSSSSDSTNLYDNNIEQEHNEYQQQCMSAEEGYSLTKLETRGEQQLRNKSSHLSSSIQTFQVFESGMYNQNQLGHADEGFNNERNYGERFESGVHDDRYSRTKSVIRPEPETLIEPDTDNVPNETTVVQDVNEITMEEDVSTTEDLDETIQINEISSSGVESPSSPCPSTSDQDDLNVINTPPSQKAFPNVPNENHSTKVSAETLPNICKNRRIKTVVDFTKRTLRSRNSLAKDMKAKSVHQLRRAVVHNQFLKEAIPLNGLNLRSRKVWSTENDKIKSQSTLKSKRKPLAAPLSAVSSSTTTTSPLNNKRSNSAWCSSSSSSKNSNSVQTRNRVQKRFSR